MVEDLLHGEENAVFGDSVYMGKKEEIAKKVPQCTSPDPERRDLTEEEREENCMLSKTRNRGEQIFIIANKIFGFSKVRYKGLAKNTNFTYVLFTLLNLYMVRRDLLSQTGE